MNRAASKAETFSPVARVCILGMRGSPGRESCRITYVAAPEMDAFSAASSQTFDAKPSPEPCPKPVQAALPVLPRSVEHAAARQGVGSAGGSTKGPAVALPFRMRRRGCRVFRVQPRWGCVSPVFESFGRPREPASFRMQRRAAHLWRADCGRHASDARPGGRGGRGIEAPSCRPAATPGRVERPRRHRMDYPAVRGQRTLQSTQASRTAASALVQERDSFRRNGVRNTRHARPASRRAARTA
jgi:hypothetical protein